MFHFKVDVDSVSDDDFAKYVRWLKYALEKSSMWNG